MREEEVVDGRADTCLQAEVRRDHGLFRCMFFINYTQYYIECLCACLYHMVIFQF